jgi:hypothetical protein
MGVGQNRSGFDPVVYKRQKTIAPFLLFQARGLMIFDFLRPKRPRKNTGPLSACQWSFVSFFNNILAP